jgi:hypothetical protein
MRLTEEKAWTLAAAAWLFVITLACLLFGCAEAVPFPTTRYGAHAWFCEREACPTEAMSRGDTLISWAYDRKARACICTLEDERHMQDIVAVPVYSSHTYTIPRSHGSVGGPFQVYP